MPDSRGPLLVHAEPAWPAALAPLRQSPGPVHPPALTRRAPLAQGGQEVGRLDADEPRADRRHAHAGTDEDRIEPEFVGPADVRIDLIAHHDHRPRAAAPYSPGEHRRGTRA